MAPNRNKKSSKFRSFLTQRTKARLPLSAFLELEENEKPVTFPTEAVSSVGEENPVSDTAVIQKRKPRKTVGSTRKRKAPRRKIHRKKSSGPVKLRKRRTNRKRRALETIY